MPICVLFSLYGWCWSKNEPKPQNKILQGCKKKEMSNNFCSTLHPHVLLLSLIFMELNYTISFWLHGFLTWQYEIPARAH